MARNATGDLSRELGTDIQLEDLHPKAFLRKHLLSEADEAALRRPLQDIVGEVRGVADTVKRDAQAAANGASTRRAGSGAGGSACCGGAPFLGRRYLGSRSFSPDTLAPFRCGPWCGFRLDVSASVTAAAFVVPPSLRPRDGLARSRPCRLAVMPSQVRTHMIQRRRGASFGATTPSLVIKTKTIDGWTEGTGARAVIFRPAA